MLLAQAGCKGAVVEAPPSLVSDGRLVMGTVLEITVATHDEPAARDAIEEAFAYAKTLESLFSHHDPESEVSQLNAAAGRGPQVVDPRLVELLFQAVDYATLTGGAFDVTVGSLIELWTEAGRRQRLPTQEELVAARLRVGAERIRMWDDVRVELPEAGMSIDLGGLGKGFALDRALLRLLKRGFENVLLSFGQSSAWATGAPPGEAGWRLLLRAPLDGFLGVMTLRDQAFAVSSSLGQWTEIQGQRYGHVVDPRSGQALTRLVQAAVVSEDGTLAEVISTALLVLDEEEGLALVESLPGTEAFVVETGGRRTMTSGWLETTRYQEIASP
jgi:thiamine biosynthesis lipoprotein